MIDHLAAEQLLIAKIKADIPEFRAVYGAGELAKIGEVSLATPSAHVVYEGEHFIGSDAGNGLKQMISQTWFVVVSINSARDQISGSGARGSAGVLIQKVIDTLAGYKLGEGMKPLKRVSPPKPVYNGSFAYFPVAFQLHFVG